MAVIESDLSDLSGLDVDRLEAQICALAARQAADECAWLLLIAEFDRREGYKAWECQSTAYWLSWHCGLSVAAGRERVRVARMLELLPLVRAEFAAGRLTYSKVRAITRVATEPIEEMLVELGIAGTAAQLERICASYRRVDRGDPSGELSEAAREEAHAAARAALVDLDVWHDDEGMTRLRGAVVPEDGALIEAALASALEQLTDAAGSSTVSAETSDVAPKPTRADALVEIARAYLSHTPGSPTVERRHLLMVMDVGVLTEDGSLRVDEAGRCTLNGQRLTPDTARRLGIDADVTTLLLDHRGLPLSVGRCSRTATAAQQLALLIRDGGCRWPGCPHRLTHAHHIIEWDNDGLTDLVNMLLLCRFHHRRVHRGGYSVELDPDTAEVEIRRPDGTLVTAREVDLGDAPLHIEIADDTLAPGEAGTHLELDDIIQNLAHRHDHAEQREQVEPDERAA